MATISTPNWQAATSGQGPQSAQINQFLGTHSVTPIYTGNQVASATGGSGNANSNGLWLAQSFTTGGGETAHGYVTAQIFPNTGLSSNLGPAFVSIYSNVAGKPGSPLITFTGPVEYVNAAPVDTAFFGPIGVSPSTQYWIVLQAAGNASFNYTWSKSSAGSGAATSPDGVTWTTQAYGFRFVAYDLSAIGNPVGTWEDGGLRWTWQSFNTTGLPNQYAEYTAGQTTLGYAQSFRTFAYSVNQVTGVS